MAVISGYLSWEDVLGSWKARWGIGRMTYIVPPGLYALGDPDEDSPVLVTANYKMSYDLVRRAMHRHNVWLMVLETYGINVWCAAGKGTFGTDELVRRIEACGVSKVVRHRQLILPTLGAAGVKAIEVVKRTGFAVLFAALRIEDLPDFIKNGMVATPKMRELTFTLKERLILTPMELLPGMKAQLIVGVPLAILAGFHHGSFEFYRFMVAFCIAVAAVVCGTVVSPVLLPVLPGRMFAVKGAIVGLTCSAFFVAALRASHSAVLTELLALVLIMSTISAFYAMNFTGSTPFTSQSGVRLEMRRCLPVMACAGMLGVLLLVVGRFIP
ncbi:MAG: acetyl-CoA synthase subunit gamma [Desulfuromonadales bacterium GWD2_54_10]|nr:MAG: acetyl-CoA synthase subunit gamma [Desulfuromonadales bacterium GWD2_54_10]